MHVGINTLFLIPGEVGGSETVLRAILDELVRLDSTLRLTLFTNRENHHSFEAFNRVPIPVAAKSRVRRIWAEQTSLPRAVRRAGVDVLYSPGYTGPLRVGCPHVVCLHDVLYKAFPAGFSFSQRLAHKLLVGPAARRASRVTTVSAFSKEEITVRLRVPEERIVVAPNAVGEIFSSLQPCSQSRPFVLCVANSYPHKNLGRLVAAFSRIADRIPHELVLVGRKRSGEPPIRPRVRRIERVSLEELAGLYQGCAAFILPSFYEGFGLPALEAMAAGARVLVSRAAALPEVCGAAGTYFDPHDDSAIANVLLEVLSESAEVRQQHIEAGRLQAAKFTWKAAAEKTLEALTAAHAARLSESFSS